jgi:hypothetical protein
MSYLGRGGACSSRNLQKHGILLSHANFAVSENKFQKALAKTRNLWYNDL